MATFKKIFALALSFLLFQTAFAQNLNDSAGLLDPSQRTEIDSRLRQISGQYGIGVYIETVEDFRKTGYPSIEQAAEVLANSKGVSDGILLLISMADRSYDLDAFGGRGNAVFKSRFDSLESAILPHLRQNDWHGGFMAFAEEAEGILGRAENRIQESGQVSWFIDEYSSVVLPAFFIVLILSIILASILLAKEKAKLNTVAMADEANRYTNVQNIRYAAKTDTFKYSTQRVIVHESNNSSSARGGGGGHSHSSGHF